MSWYTLVFEKAPAKGAPVTMHEIPRVLEDPGINDEEELAEKASDLDILFRPTFTFSGIPTNDAESKNFLEQQKTRSQNPANITLTSLQSDAKNAIDAYAGAPIGKVITGLKSVASTAWGAVSSAKDFITAPGSIAAPIRGGGNRKTQKRSKHSKTFTQSRRQKVSTNSEYK